MSCVGVTGRDPDLEFDVSTGGSAGFAAWALTESCRAAGALRRGDSVPAGSRSASYTAT